ncbi:MAG: energy transducer TonB [Elusimicrobiota bacterium]
MAASIFPSELKPYLKYSAGLHAALLAALGIVLLRGHHVKSESYSIDFVGLSSGVIENQAPASAAAQAPASAVLAPASHVAEAQKRDEFSFKRRKERKEELPSPSLLEGYKDIGAPQSASLAPPLAPISQKPLENPSRDSFGGALSMEMPDFPYPWYLTQIRMALWTQWSSQKPSEQGQCVVSFSILPDGNVVDLRTEESSGDAAFDLAALGTVKDASPFPPLPQDFKKPFLKIHLTLKSS